MPRKGVLSTLTSLKSLETLAISKVRSGVGDRRLFSAGAGMSCTLSMMLQSPAQHWTANRACMGPETLSTAAGGCREKLSWSSLKEVSK